MDLTSLKQYLKSDKPSTADFVRFLGILLQGLATHVVEGDGEELEAYREETNHLVDRISEQASTEEILLAVTMGLHSLEEYNRRTNKLITDQRTEMKTALRTMTETVLAITQSHGEAIQHLGLVERKLEQAAIIEDDIRMLSMKLQDCVVLIREESTRLRKESDKRTTTMRQQIECVFARDQPWQPGVRAIDTLTGLENHAAAERLLMARVEEGRPCIAAVFVVNKLAKVNKRFGRVIGDEVLMMAAQHIGQSLPPYALLFRWSGPALVAVLDIQPTLDVVNRKLARIASVPLEKSIEGAERSALVPVNMLLHTQEISRNSNVREVFRAMDQFVATNTLEEQPVVSG